MNDDIGPDIAEEPPDFGALFKIRVLAGGRNDTGWGKSAAESGHDVSAEESVRAGDNDSHERMTPGLKYLWYFGSQGRMVAYGGSGCASKAGDEKALCRGCGKQVSACLVSF